MRLPTRNRHGTLGFNMTPMIDVVFLLIIFFLVSSHLVKQESQLKLPLPIADSGQPTDDSQSRSVINVRTDGSLLLAGRALPIDQLEDRLRELKRRKGDMELKIRADRSVPYRSIEPILLACYRVGIGDVTYSVYRSKDVR